ncbi:hypothetical protein GCM10010124_19910 [Pilimelia terevasa]|uniref:Uncharacterized protein n=1 Tax=Pilimelia terevasa TaxID=53372 RepID=A0A8J3BPV1_9ACTN|nr:hypothetical protein [Pilimelia terevasa]GGK27342.1 hypothetical protein GCM10010124_19910 [Pilimelia terevasa]
MGSLPRSGEHRTSLVPADVLAVHVGGPASAAWREDALCRIAETEALRRRCIAEITAREHVPGGYPDPAEIAVAQAVDEAASGHLAAARESADSTGAPTLWRLWGALTGTDAVRTWANVHAAEAQVLRIAPSDVLRGALPGLVTHLRRFLPPDDLRRVQVEALAQQYGPLDRQLRESLAYAVAAGHAAQRAARSRVVRLRQIVYATGAVLTAILVSLLVVGVWHPSALSLCFPLGFDQAACPTGVRAVTGPGAALAGGAATGGDIAVVALLGVVAAALCAAATARLGRLDLPEPGLSSALLLVKLPWGGLTALLAVLVLGAGVVPFTPRSAGEILGVALLGGILQQLFSRRMDRRAATVVAAAAGKQSPGGRIGRGRRARHAAAATETPVIVPTAPTRA